MGSPYEGVLLDEFGEEIPGTEFVGAVELLDAIINLKESTVWRGMRFNGVFFLGPYQLFWIPQLNVPLPEVGDTTGNTPPKADAGGPYSGVLFAPVTFDGSASFDPDGGDIAQYDWDFGDETTLIDGGPTPSHTYTFQSNTYLVTLTVTDEDGAIDSGSTSVAIGATSAPPVADAGGPYEGTAGAALTFDGTASSDPDGGGIASYRWDFGDGNIGTGPTPTHTYTADGKYLVTVNVTDDSGEESSDGTVAIIGTGNLPPSANAGAPATGVVGVAVSFNGSASNDPDGTIAQYDWDYGDGTSDIDAGPTPSHTYSTADTYTVVLTVTDDGGATDSTFTTANIDESNQPPVANANGPYTGSVGSAVAFDGSASSDTDGTIVAYDWAFGDGNTGTGATASHSYAQAGTYEVILSVTDDDGAITADRTTASIDADNQPPVADANGPYAGRVDVPVTFDGSNSADPDSSIATYAWDFGDSTFGSGVSPQHTFARSGVYDITLTVTDNEGATDQSLTKAVIGQGNVPPEADANGPYRGEVGAPLTFDGSGSEDPDGDITAWDWDFGDTGGTAGIVGIRSMGLFPANVGTGSTVDNTYLTGGLFNVLLRVTDVDGLTASGSAIALIGDLSVPPTADASGPYNGRIGVALTFDGTASSDPDGTIARYDWDFGDGNTALDGGPTPTNTYAAGRKYIATLTVTDDSGETDTTVAAVTIGIGNLAPLADAGDALSGQVGRAITFNGTGSSDPDGTVDNYAWSFGDGNTGSGPSPSHSYAAAGRYIVALTVTDNDGVGSSDVTLADVTPASFGGGGSSSDFLGCSMGSGEVNDPILLLLVLFAVLYLARRRARWVRR